MFTTMRRSWLLFALFALVALTSALKLESLNMDGIESYIHQGKKRQAAGTGLTSSTPTSTPTPSSTPPSSSSPSSSPAESTSSTPSKESSNPPSSATSTAPPSSEPPTSTKQTSTRITAPVTRSTPLISTEVSTYTTVYTYVSDGQTHLSTGLGQKTFEHTTGSLFSTDLPSPQNGTSSGDGLSTEKKSIIGGVVGGIGGALLLGGIAIVAWRIWGRKKRVTEDDDDLTFSTGSALGGDKSSPPSSANTPFKSNLEQYHNPGGRPNAAANF